MGRQHTHDQAASGRATGSGPQGPTELPKRSWWAVCKRTVRVGFQKSASCVEQVFYAARSYSLIRPPRIGRRVIRLWRRSATGGLVGVGEGRGRGGVVDRCSGECIRRALHVGAAG
jgi:hypothetical protein